MTPLDELLERPEFDSVDLDVDIETARRQIEDAIKGLSASETEGRVKYRTTDGMLVAIVGSPEADSGEVKAKLAYRTAPAFEPATRKAAKISEALHPHVVEQ